MAQTDSEIITRLDKAGLLSEREKTEIRKNIKNLQERKEQSINDEHVYNEKHDWDFYPLQLLTKSKIYSTSGTLSLMSFSPVEVKIKDDEAQLYITRLSAFVNKVFNARLISGKTLDETIGEIKKLKLRSEYEVAAFVTKRSEIEFYLEPERYQKFADSLLSKQIITEEAYHIILKKLEQREFRNYEDAFLYLNNFLIVDLMVLPNEPLKFFEAVHRRSSEILPQLQFDSFKVKIVKSKKESYKDFIVYNAQITLTKGGKKYMQTSFYKADYKNKKAGDDLFPIDIQTYHQVFNKMLVDQGATYRLHVVKMNNYKIGLVPLTKKQSENLMWSYTGMSNDDYIQLSYENFSQKITQKNLLTAINFYDSIGLVTSLTDMQKDSAIKEAKAAQVNYYSDVLSHFPNLVYEADLEYGVNNGQYKEITKNIASISRGHFKPTRIIDGYNWKNRKAYFDFGFTLNGKNYRTQLRQEDDWLDLGFWELIEKAVSEQDKGGSFYMIYPNDGMRYVYLTNEQYRVLKDNNLLELEGIKD